ncbi:hypothetical protein GGX14DRAFT_559083 [Mycena pura]|uniref:Uncharacterized protein n=1 Tax=Mycena pura TaxID=153505 RepID=A0AAD6VXC6_9AGAR|nr:hypothetical protein GGX14DRAFT_559083 [Mycena pura]
MTAANTMYRGWFVGFVAAPVVRAIVVHRMPVVNHPIAASAGSAYSGIYAPVLIAQSDA